MVHSTPSHPWTVTWTVRLKRTWPWLSLPTRRSRPHIKPGSKDETSARSAVVSTACGSCIYAAARLRIQDTMTSGSLQGACADVRHSTHASHSTDRPSHARVAERCWSFNGITSSTRREHLGVWKAAALAWRSSPLGGLTSLGRAVCCAATCGGSTRVRTRTQLVLGCISIHMGTVGGNAASGIVRRAIVTRGSMHFALRQCSCLCRSVSEILRDHCVTVVQW